MPLMQVALNVVSACVGGGVNIYDGSGRVSRALFGALPATSLSNATNCIGGGAGVRNVAARLDAQRLAAGVLRHVGMGRSANARLGSIGAACQRVTKLTNAKAQQVEPFGLAVGDWRRRTGEGRNRMDAAWSGPTKGRSNDVGREC